MPIVDLFSFGQGNLGGDHLPARFPVRYSTVFP